MTAASEPLHGTDAAPALGEFGPAAGRWRHPSSVPPDVPVLVRLARKHDRMHSLPSHALTGRWERARRCWYVMWHGWYLLPSVNLDGTPIVTGWQPMPNDEPPQDPPMVPLSPCPFCGTEGGRLVEVCETIADGHVAHIHCEHCGADGPSVYSQRGPDPTAMRAQARWNARETLYVPKTLASAVKT